MITGLSYYDLPKYDQGYTLTQGIFCFDQQKWNLFGLVEPRVDTEGVGAVLPNIKVLVVSDSKYVVDAVTKKWVFTWEKINFK